MCCEGRVWARDEVRMKRVRVWCWGVLAIERKNDEADTHPPDQAAALFSCSLASCLPGHFNLSQRGSPHAGHKTTATHCE